MRTSCLAALGLMIVTAATPAAGRDPGRRMEDAAGPAPQVYFGDPEDSDRPAEIEAARVFAEIPEWREIQRRDLNPDQADYWILLEKANRRFYEAVAKAARELRVDLVGELGTLPRDRGEPPNVTDRVIVAIGK